MSDPQQAPAPALSSEAPPELSPVQQRLLSLQSSVERTQAAVEANTAKLEALRAKMAGYNSSLKHAHARALHAELAVAKAIGPMPAAARPAPTPAKAPAVSIARPAPAPARIVAPVPASAKPSGAPARLSRLRWAPYALLAVLSLALIPLESETQPAPLPAGAEPDPASATEASVPETSPAAVAEGAPGALMSGAGLPVPEDALEQLAAAQAEESASAIPDEDPETAAKILDLVYGYRPPASKQSVQEILAPELIRASESSDSPWVFVKLDDGKTLVSLRPYGEVLANLPAYEFVVDPVAKTVTPSAETMRQIAPAPISARSGR